MVPTINSGKAKIHIHEQGFGYLAILFLVAAMSITLAVATEILDTKLKREKEKELIFIGKQYQQAITSYYHQSPNGLKTLPSSIEELLSDNRFVKPKHHIRKLFLDPMTNQPWVIITNAQQKITGVYSGSNAPFLLNTKTLSKKLGKKIVNITQYSDLKFKFNPNSEKENFSSIEPAN